MIYIHIESIHLRAPNSGLWGLLSRVPSAPFTLPPGTKTLATQTLLRVFYVICILNLMRLYTNIAFFFLAIFHTTKFSIYQSACSVVHQGLNSCKYLGLNIIHIGFSQNKNYYLSKAVFGSFE